MTLSNTAKLAVAFSNHQYTKGSTWTSVTHISTPTTSHLWFIYNMLIMQKQKDLLPAQDVVAVLVDITAHTGYSFKD